MKTHQAPYLNIWVQYVETPNAQDKYCEVLIKDEKIEAHCTFFHNQSRLAIWRIP